MTVEQKIRHDTIRALLHALGSPVAVYTIDQIKMAARSIGVDVDSKDYDRGDRKLIRERTKYARVSANRGKY